MTLGLHALLVLPGPSSRTKNDPSQQSDCYTNDDCDFHCDALVSVLRGSSQRIFEKGDPMSCIRIMSRRGS